jgi:hypothetical protein
VDPMAIGPSRTLRVSMNQTRHTCYESRTYSIWFFLPFRSDGSHIRYLNRAVSSIDESRRRVARCSTKKKYHTPQGNKRCLNSAVSERSPCRAVAQAQGMHVGSASERQ